MEKKVRGTRSIGSLQAEVEMLDFRWGKDNVGVLVHVLLL